MSNTEHFIGCVAIAIYAGACFESLLLAIIVCIIFSIAWTFVSVLYGRKDKK